MEKNKLKKSSVRQWTEALIVAGLVAFILRTTLFGLYNVPTGSAIPTILVGDRVLGNKLVYKFGLGKPQRGDIIIFDDANYKFDRSNNLIYWWQKYVGLPVPFLGIKSGPINVTKRVIALPGDWIEGRVENNTPVIYLNGNKFNEPYVNPYPLLLINKPSGFIPMNSIGPIPIPNFLLKKTTPRYCAYDPNKKLSSQPYLTAHPSDIAYIPGYSEATFRLPSNPTYKDSFNKRGCVDTFGPMRVPEKKYWVMGDNRRDSGDSRFFGFLDGDRIQGRMSYILYSIDSDETTWLFELLKHPVDFWHKAIRWNRFFRRPTNVTPEERQIKIPDKQTMLRQIAAEAKGEKL